MVDLDNVVALPQQFRSCLHVFREEYGCVAHCWGYPMIFRAAVHTQLVPHVLGSWKEIAAFLGKGVRTVQRWEKCIGLPVHRPGGNCGVVLAYPAEIDAWCQTQFAHDARLAAETRPAESRDVLQFVLALAYSCAELNRNKELLQCEVARGKPVASCRSLGFLEKPAMEPGKNSGRSVSNIRSSPHYKSAS